MARWSFRRWPYHRCLFLDGDDPQLRGHFERLSDGGTVTLPLGKQSWGADAGSLVDRFGITWMVNINQR